MKMLKQHGWWNRPQSYTTNSCCFNNCYDYHDYFIRVANCSIRVSQFHTGGERESPIVWLPLKQTVISYWLLYRLWMHQFCQLNFWKNTMVKSKRKMLGKWVKIWENSCWMTAYCIMHGKDRDTLIEQSWISLLLGKVLKDWDTLIEQSPWYEIL